MPSFDIVSEIDMVEVRNAVDNANRELDSRFDFRGVEASFELKDNAVLISAEAEFQLNQLRDILRDKCAKRQIDATSLEAKSIERTGKMHKQTIQFKQGIDQAMAKKIVKLLKDSKIKVQAQIQGEQLRVNGKKRDDLQEAIALIRTSDLGQPFQFNNFRD
ncbi:YajQ family cyclic di-GMP-binding protein [Bowmanella sp. JS7-9]|uniref:Nucleotide-binding protein ACFP85_16095 n=1 Tax=Pseudobowmanella zhangzhouensis TaxID=1537679 RepID=A0ABW1XNB7_9ALTE|nr:YajQ family cyclic di-GMP-binding protein [Bowmanella sp. JS7-9]TBX24396.1 nucleotide-binding protein [Bowmanella sp. JS7-9]